MTLVEQHIVIDEIDAVFRKRTASTDSGEVARASTANQLLAKLDGVQEELNSNVLLIGTTNRRELLDDALVRPGRLEVHIQIDPPRKEERREILRMHFGALRQRGKLSDALCRAIDGDRSADLASGRWTSGFTGADIAGLARCAGSIALSRCRQNGDSISELVMTLEDVKAALKEVRQ